MGALQGLTSQSRRVAVIGAGVSGITGAKCLLEEGLDPVVYERSGSIGGVWKLIDTEGQHGGLAYRSLRTNTSKQIMAFSDFPFGADLPDFPPRAEVERYLNDYADHFDVRQHIRFRTTVEQVEPLDGGRWRVHSADASGERTSAEYDAVLVCSGVFREPSAPVYPGQESFTGTILHSSRYVDTGQFAGKTVAVVGVGSSGADIAVETSLSARRVLLCNTRGTWFVPRYIGGRPRDHYNTRIAARVPARIKQRTALRRVLAEFTGRGLSGRPGDYGLIEPPFASGRSTSNTGLLERAAAGAIAGRPNIVRLDGGDAVFEDGSRERVDVLIFATGYRVSFPFLPQALNPVHGDRLDLYKQVWLPDCPGIAFAGIFRVSGPALPVAEMQGRWAAHVFRGATQLPPPEAMRAWIDQRHAELQARGGSPYKLDFVAYLDDLAGEISVRSRLWRHPTLAWRLLAGPPVPAQYRLDGPGRWPGAARAIRAAARPRGVADDRPVERSAGGVEQGRAD